MKVVIPSYGRAGNVRSIGVFPDAIIVVPESQEAEYREHYSNVVTIEDKKDGTVSKKRNAVLDLFKEENIFVVDDDIIGICNHKGKMLEPEQVSGLLENGFRLAEELGCGLWGLNPTSDKLKIKDFHPFSLTKPVYHGVGILPDDIRYDEGFTLSEDVDFWINKLNRYRKVFRFNLYSFKKSDSKQGGIPDRRLKDNNERLVRKWGTRIVRISDGKLKVNTPIKGV